MKKIRAKSLMLLACLLPIAGLAEKAAKPVLISSAGGWDNYRPTVTMSVENNELVVKSSGEDPWVQAGGFSVENGPFVLELEVCSDSPGGITVFAGFSGKPFAIGSGITSGVLAKNQWNTVPITIPAGGALTKLRLDAPGKEGTTRFRNIRLKDAAGNLVKEWFVPIILG